MNGSFLASLVRAVGYAVVGASDEDERPAPNRTKRAANPYARKKGCCNAKRSASTAGTGAPVPGAQLAGMRPVRSSGGSGSSEG